MRGRAKKLSEFAGVDCVVIFARRRSVASKGGFEPASFTSLCIVVDVLADSYQSLSCNNRTITPEEIERGVKIFSAAIFAGE